MVESIFKPGNLVKLTREPIVNANVVVGALWIIIENRDSIEKRENDNYEYRKQENEYLAVSYGGTDFAWLFDDELEYVRPLRKEEIVNHKDEDVRGLMFSREDLK